MSSGSKGSMLRLIMPKDSSGKILAGLGPTTKVDSQDVTLSAGGLTTDEIVKTIKEASRLRDELLHSLRQFGIPRDPASAATKIGSVSMVMKEVQGELEDKRSRYQELQSTIDGLERELEENRKRASVLEEIAKTGFSTSEVISHEGQFNRILGRLPVSKLQQAQRAVESALKDQVALAVGAKAKDFVYVLLAAPPDKTSQAMQTLMLYDFAQTAIPSADALDLKKELDQAAEKRKSLEANLESAKADMSKFRDETRLSLNRLLDTLQDTVINLRAVLRLGEGSRASQAYAWLAKPPQPKILNTLQSLNVLFETE